MRTPQIEQHAASEKKQKLQLILLATLAVVLVGVVAVQLGGDAGSTVQPQVEDDLPVALAKTAESAAAPAISKPLSLSSNVALSRPGAVAGDLNSAAFDSFWSLDNPIDSTLQETPPPNILLSATLVGREGALDVAIIDGSLKYVGDVLHGWLLDSISSREVSLRSPGDRVVTIAMPLLQAGTQTRPSRVPPGAPVVTPPGETVSDS